MLTLVAVRAKDDQFIRADEQMSLKIGHHILPFDWVKMVNLDLLFCTFSFALFF